MRKIREVLRLKWEARLPDRQIATSCGISHPTVGRYLDRAREAGLSWPLPEEMTDEALEEQLFPPGPKTPTTERPVPDWAAVHAERKTRKVTLRLLWEEYREAHPEGYAYSRYCELYREWRHSLEPTMRLTHRAGEKLFVDYAGETMGVINPSTGEIREAQIFVAVLGASNYTFAEATWTQSLPDWIGSHVRALAFFEGVPRLIVPDNLKTGVTKASYYEPDINQTYHDLALHYSAAVLPTRVRRPRDKAKVEVGVQHVERQILHRLRHRTFFSLGELNDAIAPLLEVYNDRPFQKLPGSRRSQYEALDRPALQPLPARPYQYAEWKKARAGIDYHVEVDGHYYSVPYKYIKKTLDVRITQMTIEVFHTGTRIASHQRSVRRGRHTTVCEHMPKSHQRYAEWTPDRLIRWAAKTGESTARLVQLLLARKPHPEHGYRACMGIMRLGTTYGQARLEASCRRALANGSISYQSVKSILANGLDRRPLPEAPADREPIDHSHIRGPQYYR